MIDMTGPGSRVEKDPSLEFDVNGQTVAATRYQPTDFDGPLPAVLWYTPYHKDDETTYGRYDPLLEYVAACGYEVVVADMVGTGASTGHREEFFGPDAGAEVATVIEALAGRPWSTGRVGMLGKSFPGSFCLLAAAEGPAPLDAVVPILTTHRRERLAFNREGAQQLWLPISMVALFEASGVQPPSRRDSGWRERWRDRLNRRSDAGPPMARALDPDPNDPYWEWRIPVEEITVPTFAVGGYRDYFPADTVEYFAAIDAPKRLLMGPWRHVIPYRGRETAIGFRRQVVDWLDRFLKDEQTDPFEPTVAFWTEREGGRQVGDGVWRGRSAWPTFDRSETVDFAVTPDGLQRTGKFQSGEVVRTYEIDHTVGLDAHDLSVPFVDTNADDARSLTAETAPMDRPMELTGSGAAVVWVSADGPATVSVRLVDVGPDGRARPVTRGAARVEGAADPPARVPLEPVSHVVEEDHRLRVAISGADFPSYRPVDGPDSFTLTSSSDTPTSVRIPGSQPPADISDDTISMPAPDETIPLAPPAVSDAESSWETTREHERRSAKRRRRVRTDFALPHVEKTYELEVRSEITHDDPTTLESTASIETTLRHDDAPAEVETTVRRSLDGAAITTTVRLDGQTVFEDEWTP